MQFIMPESLSFFTIAISVAGLIVGIQGLAALFTGKLYGKEYQKYTEESITKSARPIGALTAISGIMLALSNFLVYGNLDADTSHWISIGVAFAAAVIAIILSCVMLKKKDVKK